MAKRGIGAGVIVGGSTVVLIFNLVVGVSALDPIGWGFATAAFWGLLAPLAGSGECLAAALRSAAPPMSLSRALSRLAVAVVLVKPLRYVALLGALAVVLVISTILAAALLTVSMAFAALVLSFYAIHAADRIEGRRTIVVTG